MRSLSAGSASPPGAIAPVETERQELLTINNPDAPTLTPEIAPGDPLNSTPRTMKNFRVKSGRKDGARVTEQDIGGFLL